MLSTHVKQQEMSVCCSDLQLLLQQNLTDTDGLEKDHVHFYMDIWEKSRTKKKDFGKLRILIDLV